MPNQKMYKYNIEGNQQQKLKPEQKKKTKFIQKEQQHIKSSRSFICWYHGCSINHPTYLLFAHLDKQVLKKQPTY